MPDRLVSEHFDFTPAIKSHIQKQLDYIREHLPKDASCKVSVDHEPHKHFNAVFQARAWHHDVLAKAVDVDLYTAIHKAGEKMVKNLIALRRKKLDKRRRAGAKAAKASS